MKLKNVSLLFATVMRGGIIMNKSRLLGAVCAGLLTITASSALASVVYSYDGDTFDTFTSITTYNTINSISGTVTLENLLVANTTSTPTVLDFSFTDGNQTLSMGNGAAIDVIEFTTDGNGITNWKVDLSILASAPLAFGNVTRIIKTFKWGADVVQDTGIIQTVTTVLTSTTTASTTVSTTDSGKVLNTPGSWEGGVATTVPLPAAAWLFGSGLIGLIAAGRRRKK
jgi:hypothetical protein